MNYIYRVNLDTNETIKISYAQVSNFKIIGNTIYYVKDSDHFLYSSNLDGTGEQKISDHNNVAWYDVVIGSVFYTTAQQDGKFLLYKADPAQEDLLLSDKSFDNVQIMDNTIVGVYPAGGDNGIEILDSSGNLQLMIADQAFEVFAYAGHLLFVSEADHAVKVVTVRKD